MHAHAHSPHSWPGPMPHALRVHASVQLAWTAYLSHMAAKTTPATAHAHEHAVEQAHGRAAHAHEGHEGHTAPAKTRSSGTEPGADAGAGAGAERAGPSRSPRHSSWWPARLFGGGRGGGAARTASLTLSSLGDVAPATAATAAAPGAAATATPQPAKAPGMQTAGVAAGWQGLHECGPTPTYAPLAYGICPGSDMFDSSTADNGRDGAGAGAWPEQFSVTASGGCSMGGGADGAQIPTPMRPMPPARSAFSAVLHRPILHSAGAGASSGVDAAAQAASGGRGGRGGVVGVVGVGGVGSAGSAAWAAAELPAAVARTHRAE